MDSSRPSRPTPPASATRRQAALVIVLALWACCSTVPAPAKKIPVDIAFTAGFHWAAVNGGNGVESAATASSSRVSPACIEAGA